MLGGIISEKRMDEKKGFEFPVLGEWWRGRSPAKASVGNEVKLHTLFCDLQEINAATADGIRFAYATCCIRNYMLA
jgi:hypothetical protein